jgi:hypothetical protein
MQKKLITLIIITTILFGLLFGCTEKVSWCENQYDQSGLTKDTCYYNESIKQNNPNLCHNIESERLKEICLYGNTIEENENTIENQTDNTEPNNINETINNENNLIDNNEDTIEQTIDYAESNKIIQKLNNGDDFDWQIYKTASRSEWHTAEPIAILDLLKTGSTIEFILKNNGFEIITLTGLELSNSEKTMEISKILNPGNTVNIKVQTNSDCEENNKYYFPRNEIKIYYINSNQQKKIQYGIYEIIDNICG